MDQATCWTAMEVELRAEREYARPLWDVDPRVAFVAPSGRETTVDAFWDGGRTWRARICADEVGEWTWTSRCPGDRGLDGQRETFSCEPYEGATPVHARGALRVASDGRHFEWADGTPMLWLADTAWNGAIRSDEDGWLRYLRHRAEQAFTAVQFVTTQWRAASADAEGHTAYLGGDQIGVEPAWFQRMDGRVDAINAAGLIAAPVVLWACTDDDPGRALSVENATRLARYIVSRWQGHRVVWILAGDGNYRGENVERWRRIGRSLFAAGSGGRRSPCRHLVCMHLGGQSWLADELREESWLDFIGYQSGHGSSEEHLRWLLGGPPATEWARGRAVPVLNMEPNYEQHPSYHGGARFTAHQVRRAAWWSLLLTPTAGVTYGHNWIWPWADVPELPEGHEGLGIVQTWRDGLKAPGAAQVARACDFLRELDWWRLRPAQELLAEQPGQGDAERFLVAAATPERDLALAYTPVGGTVALRAQSVPGTARWFDPRRGVLAEAQPAADRPGAYPTPTDEDWVLVLER